MTVCVFSTSNEVEAGIVKTALDEKGINNILKNTSSLAYLGANLLVGNMEVFVHEDNVDKALEILKTLFDYEEENINESEDD